MNSIIQNIAWLDDFVNQRMKEKGYDHFHFEPYSFETEEEVGEYHLVCSNQYLYPVMLVMEAAVTISSDVAVTRFEPVPYFPGCEHTGNITIELDDPSVKHNIHFIKVIPGKNEKEKAG